MGGAAVCFLNGANYLIGRRGNRCAAVEMICANVRIFYAGGIIYSRGEKVISGVE